MFEVRRHIRFCWLAIAALMFSPLAIAAPALLYVPQFVASAASGEYTAERFRAELSLMAQAEDGMTAVRSDLRREGHGFRMASADEYDGLAALT